MFARCAFKYADCTGVGSLGITYVARDARISAARSYARACASCAETHAQYARVRSVETFQHSEVSALRVHVPYPHVAGSLNGCPACTRA